MNFYLRLAAWAARSLPQPLITQLYRIPCLAKLIRHALNQAAPDGLTETIIAAGNLSGMRMMLNLKTEKDYWLGTYEPHLQTAAGELVRNGMVLYDIGANIGYISLMLARLSAPQGQVFSFEALPANLQRLQENVKLNGMESRIHIQPRAVIDQSRKVKFLIHSSTSMGKAAGSAGRMESYDQEITIPGIALDDFVYREKNPAPDLIKMDIEGGEVLAVAGMRQVLKEHQPVFLIELHGEEAAQVIWNQLSAAGYTIMEMKKGYPIVRSLSQLDWKAYIVAKPGSK